MNVQPTTNPPESSDESLARREAERLAARNGEMLHMLNCMPSGLGALRIVRGVPEKAITLNKYFFERIALENEGGDTVRLERFTRCLHPDDRARCEADFTAFLAERGLMSRQYRFLSARTGTYYWCSVRANISSISEDTDFAYFVYTDIDELKRAELELRESRRRYERTLDATQTAMWTYDIPGRRIILGDNAATLALSKKFGWPQIFENAPESTLDSIEERDRDKYLAMFREIEAGHDASCDFWYKQRAGLEPYCERESYSVVLDEAGKPVLAYGIGQNITAEKKSEERYRREMEYMRHNSDESLIAKGHYNLTQNTVLEYDSSFRQNIYSFQPGISYDDAYEGMLRLSYDTQDRRKITEKLERKSLIRRYRQGETQTTLQYRRIVEGQDPIWISMTVHLSMMPETGDIELFSYAYDITGRKLIDTVMDRIAEEDFDYIGLIFSNTDQFEFLVKSPHILYPKVRERAPYTDCCGYVRRNFVNEDEKAQFDEAVSLKNILAGLEENGRHAATYRRTENGRIFCKQIVYVWLDRAGGVILVVRSDVTAAFDRDRKQLAEIQAARLEAERANEAKSVFLSSMSHDLRTPLNGVLGFTALALRETDPEKKQDYLQKIDSSGKLLLDLVNDTLELSRIESGKIVLEPEAVLPEELIPSVVTALRPSAELKHIELVTDLPADDTEPVWCDRLKLQKIALNLISNAIKYTPEGGRVSVSLKKLPTNVPGCEYSFVVEDSGIGMSEEFMSRMYEPFSQEKRSESIRVPGTGLGLAIVKRYVDLMGGEISVESRVHEGTRFTVSLPVARAGAEEPLKRGGAALAHSLAGTRVLLCEDNYMNTEIAVMLLKERGVETDCAENGQEGVEKFASSDVGFYDAVLMDLRMPVMDGCEATRRIRALDRADAGRVPVIAMTADAFSESVRTAREAGMDAYVTKPVEPDRLCEVLAEQIAARGDS